MMSDEVADPVETGLRDEDLGLAHRAAVAVTAYRSGDREPLAALVGAMTPLLWRTVRSQGVDIAAAQQVIVPADAGATADVQRLTRLSRRAEAPDPRDAR